MSNAGSTLEGVLLRVIRAGVSFEESWRVSRVEVLYPSKHDVSTSMYV